MLQKLGSGWPQQAQIMLHWQRLPVQINTCHQHHGHTQQSSNSSVSKSELRLSCEQLVMCPILYLICIQSFLHYSNYLCVHFCTWCLDSIISFILCYLTSSQLLSLRVWITCHHNHHFFYAKTLSSWHLLYIIYIHMCLLFTLFTCYFISYFAYQCEFGVDKFLWQAFSLGILEVWVLPGWTCLGARLNGVLSSSWMSKPSVAPQQRIAEFPQCHQLKTFVSWPWALRKLTWIVYILISPPASQTLLGVFSPGDCIM